MQTEKKARKSKQKRLSVRQQKLVDELANPATKSVADAARKAGFAPSSIRSTVYRVSNDDDIIERIEMRKRHAEKLANITPEQILGATAAIAFASIDDALDRDGYLDITKARETGAVEMIKKINRSPTKYGESVSVEFYSKADALSKLGNYVGVEKFAPAPPPDESEYIKYYKFLLEQLVGWKHAQIVAAVREQFPEFDPKMLKNAAAEEK